MSKIALPMANNLYLIKYSFFLLTAGIEGHTESKGIILLYRKKQAMEQPWCNRSLHYGTAPF